MAALVAGPAAAALTDAIEFYNESLDHYFVTSGPDEINKLDTGFFSGWKRTGLGFKVADAATVAPGLSPVCRFYGSPAAGLDSHFYSASPAECAEVKLRFANAWLLESMNVFELMLPDPLTGACASGTVAVYRSWNNRVDSNHRYTTDANVQRAMIAKGYVAEGYGPPAMPVAMCSPTVDPGARPACSLVASNGAAVVGSSVSLSANCSGNPTSFSWTGCSSVTSGCTATSATAGTATYTVVASNANGASVPTSIDIVWLTPPPPEPPPVCSVNVTGQSATPTVGDLVALYANCTGSPTSYEWSGCISTTNVCRVRGSVAGPTTYSVTARNSSGGGSANINVTWVASPAAPSGLCGQFPSALYSDTGSSNTTLYSVFYPELPAFAWNGAWAIRLVMPASAQAGQFGSIAAAEFGGPPTFREVTISRSACDFRSTDPTGAAGPLGRALGTSANLVFTIGGAGGNTPRLAPGQVYYFNVRNFDPSTGTITCSSAQQRCDALVTTLLPR